MSRTGGATTRLNTICSNLDVMNDYELIGFARQINTDQNTIDYSGSIWQDTVDDSLFMIIDRSDWDPNVFDTLEMTGQTLVTDMDDNIKTGRYRRML